MAQITTYLNCQRSVLVSKAKPNTSNVQSNEYTINFKSLDAEQFLLLGFSSLSSSYKYRRVYSAKLIDAYIKRLNDGDSNSSTVRLLTSDVLPRDFNIWATTWNTAVAGDNYNKWHYYAQKSISSTEYVRTSFPLELNYITDAATHALALTKNKTYFNSDPSFVLDIARPPEIAITLDSEVEAPSFAVMGTRPSYVNRKKAFTFQWSLYMDSTISAVGPIGQTEFKFEWSSDGGTTWNSTTVYSSKTSYTVPAGTFPSGNITVRVTSIDYPHEHNPTTISFTTVDSPMVDTPVEPVSAVIDGAESITFRWSVSNSYGNAPLSSTLQYSTDGATWQILGTVSGAGTSYTAAASRFSPGTYYWRVMSNNTDNVSGAWSAPATFIFMQAPEVTGISVNAVPFASVSWSASAQQAYEVFVDGVSQGVRFGTDKAFSLSSYLEDGSHTIGVRTQNIFSLWSEISQVTFDVTNDPGTGTIDLSVLFDRDALLTWTADPAQSRFYVYRDGVQIGTTTDSDFLDRFVLGEHGYYVISKLADGNYRKSNVVYGTLKSCTTAIDTLRDPRGWLELRLTANDPDEQVFSWQRTASLRHFAGAALPVLELSPYEDGSGTYDVAFNDLQAAQAFEALKGKVVIIKSRGGNVVVGALLQLQKRVGDFFIVYDFTVQQIAWEDYVDDDQNS